MFLLFIFTIHKKSLPRTPFCITDAACWHKAIALSVTLNDSNYLIRKNIIQIPKRIHDASIRLNFLAKIRNIIIQIGIKG